MTKLQSAIEVGEHVALGAVEILTWTKAMVLEMPWATFLGAGWAGMAYFGVGTTLGTASMLMGIALVVIWIMYKLGQNTEPTSSSSSTTTTNTVETIVPYDDWPNDCHTCDSKLGEMRAQFVVHKGDNPNQMKAIALCESCARVHGTIIDYDDEFAQLFDNRDEPDEL